MSDVMSAAEVNNLLAEKDKRIEEKDKRIAEQNEQLIALAQETTMTFQVARKKCFKNRNQLNPRRKSLDKLDSSSGVNLADISSHFPFQNRTDNSKEYSIQLKALFELSEKFPNTTEGGNISDRNIKFPTILGPAGVGKTTFVRRALQHYLETVDDVFVKMLVTESFSIRLSCKEQYVRTEKELAIKLLYEVYKYNLRNENQTLESTVVLFNRVELLTLSDVVDYIFLKSKKKILLVNLDEVNTLAPGDLEKILKLFADELCHGKKVFVSVTGIYTATISNHFRSSDFKYDFIYLKPLKLEHDFKILSDFFNDSITQDTFQSGTNQFMNALWLFGGIPRLLGALLEKIWSIKERDREINTKTLLKYCIDLTKSDLDDILNRMINDMDLKIINSLRMAEIYSNLASLCISCLHVSDTTILSADGEDEYTVQHAACDQYCYRIGQADGLMSVYIIPFYLQLILTYASNAIYKHPLIRDITSPLDSRGNEALLPMRVLNTLSALRLNKEKNVLLSRILQYQFPTHEDVMVNISKMTDFKLNILRKVVCKKSNNFPTFPPGAYLNGKTASFADAWIRIKDGLGKNQDYYIFFQGKLGVIDMLNKVFGLNITPVNKTLVGEEYEKVEGLKCLTTKNHKFVVTSDQKSTNLYKNQNNVVFLDNEKQDIALGPIVAGVRLMSTKSTSVDIFYETPDIDGAGKGTKRNFKILVNRGNSSRKRNRMKRW